MSAFAFGADRTVVMSLEMSNLGRTTATVKPRGRMSARSPGSVAAVGIRAVGGPQRSDSFRGATSPLVLLTADADALTFNFRFGLGRIFRAQVAERSQVRWIAAARHFPEGGIVIMLAKGDRWVFRTLVNVPAMLSELAALGYRIAEEP
jgi:hypothetical protein